MLQLRRFIGIANFYRQHIPHFSHIMARPLFDIKEPFLWSKEAEEAFSTVKRALEQVALLQSPDQSLPYHIYTDASGIAVGATILQKNRPLSYFSLRLSPTEMRYSTFDREALAVVKVLKTYKHWLAGATVVIHTDHKPLLAFSRMKDPSPRQARWIEFLMTFTLIWQHERGVDNTAADYLSRQEKTEVTTDPHAAQCSAVLATSTTIPTDSVHCSAIVATPNSEWLDDLTKFNPDSTGEDYSKLALQKRNGIWFDFSTGAPRLLVPPCLRSSAFHQVHDIAHLGVKEDFIRHETPFHLAWNAP